MVGGPDIDSRLGLIQHLLDDYELMAAGSDKTLQERFQKAGIIYWSYKLNRGINPLHDLQMVLVLRRIFLKVHPAIVHTFDTKPGVFARLAAWLAGVPVIIGTLPGLGTLYSKNDLRTRLILIIYQPLQKLACHLSGLTIFQNPDDATQFIKSGIVEEGKTIILPGSGIDTQIFDPTRFGFEEKSKIRTSLGLDESDVIVTMVSRLIRSKGVFEFAWAAQVLREHYPQAVFLLVGPDDSESVNALTHVEREKVTNSVRWLGIRNDIPELLGISDIFVLPTYYREGIPRVLLEAASMGLPLVTTILPGCTEIVEHEKNGCLIPARDVEALEQAIETLILNPSLRKRFGEASRQRAMKYFDLTIIAEQTAQIYKKLLAEKLHGKQKDS